MEASSSSSTFVADAKPKLINGKIVWAGGPSIKQHFALPESIMYYIAKNPSTPEVYKKLIQSCKYFFEKMQILVASNMTETCILAGNWQHYEINNIKSKIWLSGELGLIHSLRPSFVSSLLPKLYRCDIIDLDIHDKVLTFEEFKLLISSVERICMGNVKMTYSNGKDVMIDEILESIPNLQSFRFFIDDDDDMIAVSTIQKIGKSKKLANLKDFELNVIPEIFNVEDFVTLIKQHKDTRINLQFCESISEEYKAQLNDLINMVIETHFHKCVICYPGQNRKKLNIMRQCYNIK